MFLPPDIFQCGILCYERAKSLRSWGIGAYCNESIVTKKHSCTFRLVPGCETCLRSGTFNFSAPRLYFFPPVFRIEKREVLLNHYSTGGININILTRGFPASLRVLFIASLFAAAYLVIPLAIAYSDEEEQAPVDPDISDICTLSDCNPAKPCLEEDEKCYTLNGVFYCCVMPPSGGAEAVGE